MPIPLYILKRLLYSIPTIFLVSVIGFLLMRFKFGTYEIPIPFSAGQTYTLELKNPIDPLADLRHNPAVTFETLEREKARLGLDKPMHVQYGLWLKHIFRFDVSALQQGRFWAFFKPDLGINFNGEDVATMLMLKAGNTFLLNAFVVLATWLVALPLGVYAALHWRSFTDRLLTLLSSFGMAAPPFVIALLVGNFVVDTQVLPFGGIVSANFDTLTVGEQALDLASHLIIPVSVLTLAGIASIQRQMRGNLLDVLQAEYVRVARAKGLAEHVVIYKHAVRTAINPLITMLGYEFSALLSGSLIIEQVLNYPGLGQFIYQALLRSDTNTVMASLVMSAIMLIIGNLLADILLKIVDPRIELA